MKSFKKNFSFIMRFSLNDFKSKYSGSALGAFWAIAEPLVTVLIYMFVYTVAFGKTEVDGIPYYLWLSVGIALWFFVAEGLRSITSVYRDYSYVIKKIGINKKTLPYARALSTLYSHILFMVIVLIVSLTSGVYVKNILCLFIMIVICHTFIILLGKSLSVLCGYLKDTGHVLSVILNILFWLTPIFWDIDTLPDNIKTLININPIALLAEGYRNSFFYGNLLSIQKLMYLLFIFIFLYLISYFLEKKFLPDIADKL